MNVSEPQVCTARLMELIAGVIYGSAVAGVVYSSSQEPSPSISASPSTKSRRKIKSFASLNSEESISIVVGSWPPLNTKTSERLGLKEAEYGSSGVDKELTNKGEVNGQAKGRSGRETVKRVNESKLGGIGTVKTKDRRSSKLENEGEDNREREGKDRDIEVESMDTAKRQQGKDGSSVGEQTKDLSERLVLPLAPSQVPSKLTPNSSSSQPTNLHSSISRLSHARLLLLSSSQIFTNRLVDFSPPASTMTDGFDNLRDLPSCLKVLGEEIRRSVPPEDDGGSIGLTRRFMLTLFPRRKLSLLVGIVAFARMEVVLKPNVCSAMGSSCPFLDLLSYTVSCGLVDQLAAYLSNPRLTLVLVQASSQSTTSLLLAPVNLSSSTALCTLTEHSSLSFPLTYDSATTSTSSRPGSSSTLLTAGSFASVTCCPRNDAPYSRLDHLALAGLGLFDSLVSLLTLVDSCTAFSTPLDPSRVSPHLQPLSSEFLKPKSSFDGNKNREKCTMEEVVEEDTRLHNIANIEDESNVTSNGDVDRKNSEYVLITGREKHKRVVIHDGDTSVCMSGEAMEQAVEGEISQELGGFRHFEKGTRDGLEAEALKSSLSYLEKFSFDGHEETSMAVDCASSEELTFKVPPTHSKCFQDQPNK
ncbi:unnamed protein product [Protopolystoma xenopodis]|uniref:Uncharacterized protein n=1 Tax=Protopolystoma xenopodis TaxID=117903 RepID=A0A3S5B1T0_9PLAT|nr:unnamed protein product [Protopolystoma xenopodis]